MALVSLSTVFVFTPLGQEDEFEEDRRCWVMIKYVSADITVRSCSKYFFYSSGADGIQSAAVAFTP